MNTADPAPRAVADAEIFSVSTTMDVCSWLFCEHPRLSRALGNFETSLLQDAVDATPADKPVWVTGLARSGSTLLLEILAGAPGVVSQTYKDFPPVFTPYAWNSLLRHMSATTDAAAERAHRDGIMVTPDSPEAMEEPVWMSFFPHAHNPAVSSVIDADADPACAAFLRNHIRKLLAVRGGTRYLAKANYQVTRMEYLLRHFPDARFVVPVRDPTAHIASLMKQHDLFSRGQAANARARRHLRRVGHYEFGLDRSPVHAGNAEMTRQIQHNWADGNEVQGWALYWADIYGYIADRLQDNAALAKAVLIVDYATLCAEPATTLEGVFEHCDLQVGPDYTRSAADRIAAPTYYRPDFSDAELGIIKAATAGVVDRLHELATA